MPKEKVSVLINSGDTPESGPRELRIETLLSIPEKEGEEVRDVPEIAAVAAVARPGPPCQPVQSTENVV